MHIVADSQKRPSPLRLFRFEILNAERKPVMRGGKPLLFYTYAANRQQAWIKARARSMREGWGEYFEMESYFIRIVDVGEEKSEQTKKDIMSEFPTGTACPNCGGDAEEDYCKGCGWQRLSSWFSRGMSLVAQGASWHRTGEPT